MSLTKFRSTYSGLPGSVYIIFFARIVNSMGNFVFPFMTLLLTSKIHIGEERAGMYLLIASVLQVPGSMLGGKLCDVMGRKKIMITFMGLAGVCFIPCIFFIDNPETLAIIPLFLILSSFFSSVSSPASGAMMNDLTNPENRQSAFSLLYMGLNVGAAIGSMIAGYLFNNHMQILFLGDIITTLLAIILLSFFVKETRPTNEDLVISNSELNDEKAVTGGLLAAMLRRPGLLVFALLDTIYAFIYAQTRFSMPLHANSVFGEELGSRYFGTLNTINCLEVIVLTTLITFLTRKIRAIYNIAIAGIFYAVGFGMLFVVNSFWLFVLSTVIWTIGEIISATNVGVYIANHAPITHRGRFNAVIHIITGTGSSIAPYIMGGFISHHGVKYVWPIQFFLGVSAAFLMFLLGTYEKKYKGNHDAQRLVHNQ